MKDMNFVDIGDIRASLINAVQTLNHVIMERDQLYAVLTYLIVNMGENNFSVEIDELKQLLKEYSIRFLPGENNLILNVEMIKNDQ